MTILKIVSMDESSRNSTVDHDFVGEMDDFPEELEANSHRR